MKRIPISAFKATCLSVLDDVARTGETVVVTRRGVPIARVEPPSLEPPRPRRLGGLRGTARIRGDIIAPVADPEDWDALG